ncbi:hypothetical protein AWB68_07830 [Caballeronia choica]|jgi:hypothetical protein|uniref:Uncharacterized protein n=1 Tax=Caballeronia choica TaxID=326476 RepID=A0A158KY27_9BURK|nr:hypothetical protein AWB68_07830 [Caballeronia choica]
MFDRSLYDAPSRPLRPSMAIWQRCGSKDGQALAATCLAMLSDG